MTRAQAYRARGSVQSDVSETLGCDGIRIPKWIVLRLCYLQRPPGLQIKPPVCNLERQSAWLWQLLALRSRALWGPAQVDIRATRANASIAAGYGRRLSGLPPLCAAPRRIHACPDKTLAIPRHDLASSKVAVPTGPFAWPICSSAGSWRDLAAARKATAILDAQKGKYGV